MALDGLLLNRIVDSLQEILPTRIHKIYNISENELLFQLRSAKEKNNLLISCHSVYNRLQLSDRTYTTPEEPSNFTMLLRKHCEGGWITSMKQVGLDRLVEVTINLRDDLGDNHISTLYIELMGKYANLILVGADGRIMDALKRIPPFENTKRTIQPGAVFVLPEIQEKRNPFMDNDPDLTQSLTSQYHGFSPLLTREMQYRIMNGQSFSEVMKSIAASNCLYLSTDEKETHFHCIPLTHLELPTVELELMKGLDEVYFQKEEKERIRAHTGDLLKFVQREIKKYTSKLPKLTEALDEALDCDKWRAFGELLYAYGLQTPKGSTELTVEAFDGSGPVKIPLDSKADGKTNAKKYFQKYQKGKKGQVHILNQLEICENELAYYQGIHQQLSIAGVPDAIEIRQELADGGLLKATVSKVRKRKKQTPQYLSFTLDNGVRIHLGKNNLQNDFITFKLAKKKDTWLHAKDYHGAHVIIETDTPDETTLRTAAQLAAYYSQARNGSSVPVNYCPIANVKKIPGAKPGFVALGSYKTIYIDPEVSFIENLLVKNKTVS